MYNLYKVRRGRLLLLFKRPLVYKFIPLFDELYHFLLVCLGLIEFRFMQKLVAIVKKLFM